MHAALKLVQASDRKQEIYNWWPYIPKYTKLIWRCGCYYKLW